MTIEEIKEWRNTVETHGIGIASEFVVEIIDTLLAEVEDLNILNGENKIIIGAYTRQKERYDVCYRREFEAKRQLKAAESEITELDAALSKTNKKLTTATEALERIATNPLVHSSNHQSEMRPDEIARTALERIKE